MIPGCPPPREPTRPKRPPPPRACDTHAHVFGPAGQFPYAADRSYTPPDAPLEKYLAMLATVGFARGVLVQGSAHGRDNAAMLDALARHPGRLRGVAVADADVSAAELRRWHAGGLRGLRFNQFFRAGRLRATGDGGVRRGGWPPPRVEGERPDAGRLFELFQQRTPDDATRRRMRGDNPARPYGFPTCCGLLTVALEACIARAVCS